jgi:hypothetical protein
MLDPGVGLVEEENVFDAAFGHALEEQPHPSDSLYRQYAGSFSDSPASESGLSPSAVQGTKRKADALLTADVPDAGRNKGKQRAEPETDDAVSPGRPAVAPASAVAGVNWDKGRTRWEIRLKGPNDKNRHIVNVSISAHQNDIDAARQAAETIAQQIKEGTYVWPIKRIAAHTIAVTGVHWHAGQNKWEVRLKGPNDTKPLYASVRISAHHNDIDAARQAAETIAQQIKNGTYRPTI